MSAGSIPSGNQIKDPGYPTASENYLTNSKGPWTWLFTLDHKRIGVMYLIGVMTAFFAAGLLALLIRLHLFRPEGAVFTGPEANNWYNQVFTLHGAIMVFLFIIPSIPAALGNFLVPVMLGAKDVAFPRLNLSSFYLWVFGALFFVGALMASGLDTGWTFYTPYSTSTDSSVILATSGAFILGFSSIFTGLNFIVTINTMRPPGMTWFRMPLFLWATYATSIIQVLATPVLGITLLLLIAERVMHIGIFDPEFNGDPVTIQHYFWFYSHPAVYIMILPAFGVISDLISVHSHKRIFGYRFIAYSSIAIALLGFLVWGHHMFTAGMGPMTTIIFKRPDLHRIGAVRHQGLQLACNHVQRVNQFDDPDVLCIGLHFPIHNRRTDRTASGYSSDRHAPPRHLFRGRPLPLRDGGGNTCLVPRSIVPLVAKNVWKDVQRVWRSPCGSHYLPRIQPNVSPSVCAW